MPSELQSTSKGMLWTGRVLSGLVTLFMLFDAAVKIMKVPAAVQGTMALGYPLSTLVGIGVACLVCVILYTIPQTAVFGAILLTGYLGGAVASNVRMSYPWFSYALAPVYVAILMWGGLYLRDARLRALVPLRKI